jgi:hypothetical protein
VRTFRRSGNSRLRNAARRSVTGGPSGLINLADHSTTRIAQRGTRSIGGMLPGGDVAGTRRGLADPAAGVAGAIVLGRRGRPGP